MAKLRDIMRRTRDTNGRRFYTSRDMSEIKHYEAVTQSQRNRGEVSNHNNRYISVCGCGVEGCFIHSTYPSRTPEEQISAENWKQQYKEIARQRQEKKLEKRKIRQSRSKSRIKAKQRK